jgi:hypothetical protein
MKTFQKNVTAVSLLAVLTLGLASCSADTSPSPLSSDGSIGKSSSSTPKPTSSTETGPTPAAVAKGVNGDYVIKTNANGEPVTVTDSLGTYTNITVNPEDESLTLDKSKHDAEVTAYGWSDEDLLSAQQWVVKFAIEQGIDSIAVDTDDGWERWKAEEASKYIAPEWMNMIAPDATHGDNSDRPSIIFNNSNNKNEDLLRGDTRAAHGEVSVTKVTSFPIQETGTQSLGYTIKASVAYKVSDESLLASYKANNPDKTEKEIIAENPFLVDGKVQTFPEVTFDFDYYVQKVGDSWGLSGYNTKWDLGAVDKADAKTEVEE